MSRTGIILFLLLVGFAVLTSWLKRETTEVPIRIAEKTHAADFFMERFHLQQYDETGNLLYRLKGSRMEHYLENKTSVITNPDFLANVENVPGQWQVSAQQAITKEKEPEEISFRGNVVFKRPQTETVPALSLTTEQLLIQPNKEYVETTGIVSITSEAAFITGENLQADVKQGHFTLQHVKGRYVP